jgi:hypothetical protein
MLHLARKPFLKVEFPDRVIGVGVRLDFDVAPDGYSTGGKRSFTVDVGHNSIRVDKTVLKLHNSPNCQTVDTS